MMNQLQPGQRLADLIRDARTGRGWRFGDLARQLGASTPRETSRLSLRLVRIEREGLFEQKLLLRVIGVLGLDPALVNRLLDEHRRTAQLAYEAWLNEEVPIELHVRPFAGFWYKQHLPDETAGDTDRVIAYARELTYGREEVRAVVALSRRLSVIVAQGEVVGRHEGEPVMPVVRVGRAELQFEAKP